MRVIKISPRGYCYGVVDAIQMAKRVARDPNVPRPIHVLGQIVHNHHAVESLNALGIVTLDGSARMALLDRISEGTVIFTAHGVSPAIKTAAAAKGLNCIDATCPDVTKTHDLVISLVSQGYEVIYVGKTGHPEPEGVIGEAPGHVHLVETSDDVDKLKLTAPLIAVATQTTLSRWDTASVIDHIKDRYPQAVVNNDICHATHERQEAATTQVSEADLVLVVGDERSNNSKRLVQVVQEIAGKPARLIDSVDDIDPAWFNGLSTVAVTSGSSTPTEITRAVIQLLEALEPLPAAAN
ncbi:MAG: 1-hydroxy-2-methyl-2-(E)-butenyl 4-diphosphate reductase [Chloroflexi bacterium]|nr:1-hydroxy-2-methyl-2-(E)-butenyl 4-diphosphate reductase [Chloroflexota bacterium]